MKTLEELKKTLAEYLRTRKYVMIIEGKTYSPNQLADAVEKGTPIGKKLIEMAIKGTIDRYRVKT